MKKDYFVGAILAILLIGCVWAYIKYSNFNPTNYDELLLKEIRNLEFKIDYISNEKDSIKSFIDSTHVRIITNEKHYKEVVNIIMVQPSSADSEYVANYIRLYSIENDSNNIR